MEFLAAGGKEPAGSTLVKSNLYRSVWRVAKAPPGVAGPAGAYYFKSYLFPRLRDRIKYSFFQTRAEVEWKVARGLAQRGIRTLAPVLFAERRRFGVPVEAYFLSREIEGAEPLDRFLSKLSPASRAACLERMAAFVAAMHSKSVHHRDLHQSNLLGLDPKDPKIALVDLHTAHLGAHISRRRRIRNLAQLLHSLQPTLLAGEKEKLLEHYRAQTGGVFPDAKKLAAAIERRIWRIGRIQARSRDKRCLVRSSAYDARRGPFESVYRRRDWPEPWIGKAIEKHEQAPELPQSLVLKREGRSLVTKIPWAENGGKIAVPSLCVKEIGRGGLGSLIEEAARGTRGRRAWAAAHALSRRGIATPAAYALREQRLLGLPLRSHLITEFLEGTESLLQFLGSSYGSLSRSERAGFIAALAALTGKLHREGLYHRDFQVRNLLVRRTDAKEWQIFLIDLESLRPRARLTRARRLRNLTQLNDCPKTVSRADRLRFLRAYELAWGQELSKEDLRWVADATKARLDRAARKSTS